MQNTALRILLVVDDLIYQFVAKKILESTGLTGMINFCANGKEAMDHLTGIITGRGALPNVIFLDINMPVMNGWEFLETYENLKCDLAQNIIIYIVTSSADAFDIRKSKEFETVKGFMVKPVSMEQFYRVLSNI